MFYEKELVFIKKVLKKLHLNLNVLNPQDYIKNHTSLGFEALIDTIDPNARFCDHFPDLHEHTLYKLSDILTCKFIILRLPKTEMILVIGPYLLQDISRSQVLENGEKLKFTPNMIKALEFYYTTIPVLRDEGQFFALINTFCEQLWGSLDGYSVVDLDHDDTASLFNFHQEKHQAVGIDSNWKIDLMEKRYAFEEELLHAVSKGQIHKAEQMMTSFSSLSLESRVNDDLRNLKNYCIIMNTLLRKAAQDGGVHPIHLDTISSDFAKRIEQMTSINSIRDLISQMLNTYCRLVRKHSIKQYSPLVQRAIIKIDGDLTADLSLKQLAQLNNVSTSYFSTLFKNETGQTLTDYVNKQRINQAKHLLRTTNLQIQTIAQHCGILDLHYFSKLFKRYVGKTPKEYREMKTVIQ